MKKTIIFPAIFTLILPFALHTMEPPSLMQHIKDAISYPFTTKTIDIALGVKQVIQKPIQSTHPDKFIQAHQNKLKKMEQNLRETEQNQINTIFKKNGLNDEQIKEANNKLKEYHYAHTNFLRQPNTNVIHDPQLAEPIDIIKKQLAQNGMTIESINIVQSNDFPYNAVASGESVSMNTTTFSGKTFFRIIKPAQITFHPKSINDPQIKAITIHEAEHIINGHSITQNVISSFINTKNNTLTKSQSYQQLRQTHERQAEVFPSLRDAECASIMRASRSNEYYPNMLYGEHYLQLSEIDETHKMIAYLEQAKQNPRPTAMPQIKISKFWQQPLPHLFVKKPAVSQVRPNTNKDVLLSNKE